MRINNYSTSEAWLKLQLMCPSRSCYTRLPLCVLCMKCTFAPSVMRLGSMLVIRPSIDIRGTSQRNPRLMVKAMESVAGAGSDLPAGTGQQPLQRLAVFCGASFGKSDAYSDAARSLGEEMVRRKLGLVYGGAPASALSLFLQTAFGQSSACTQHFGKKS